MSLIQFGKLKKDVDAKLSTRWYNDDKMSVYSPITISTQYVQLLACLQFISKHSSENPKLFKDMLTGYITECFLSSVVGISGGLGARTLWRYRWYKTFM